MHPTPRLLQVLRFLRRYKVVDRALIQFHFFPRDKDGSVTREFLRKLVAAGLARRLVAEVADPLTTATAPVYVPTDTGCCLLAAHASDPSQLLDRPPNCRAWTSLRHWVCLSDLMATLDAAVAAQSLVRCPRLIFEHDIVNPDAQNPAERFLLYTDVTSPGAAQRRVVCVPDAALELAVGAHRRAFYVELERGLDAPSRVAASKAPGYHGLFESKKFQRHFEGVADFRVLCVCPSPWWRDAVRKAVSAKPGASRWLFAARAELTEQSFLHAPVFFPCEGEPRPLVKAPPLTLGDTEHPAGVVGLTTA